tara:strand:+ start:1442 stop:1882 length:441 start_codon:yes stop_codon:yes gene_type:complete
VTCGHEYKSGHRCGAPNRKLSNYIDQASAAIDKACQGPEFNSMSVGELTAKAEAMMTQGGLTSTIDTTGQGGNSIWWDSTSGPATPATVPFAPEPIAPVPLRRDREEDVEKLQDRIELLEEKLAIIWSLLKMSAKEKDNGVDSHEE